MQDKPIQITLYLVGIVLALGIAALTNYAYATIFPTVYPTQLN